MEPGTTEQIQELMQELYELLSNNDFDAVDSRFSSSDVTAISVYEAIILLRFTYTARSLLSEWETFLVKVVDEFNRRGLDTRRLLSGLVVTTTS